MEAAELKTKSRQNNPTVTMGMCQISKGTSNIGGSLNVTSVGLPMKINANYHNEIIKRIRKVRQKVQQLLNYIFNEEITYSELNKLCILEAVTHKLSMNSSSHRDIIKKVRTLRKRARQLKDYFLDEKITYRFINNYDLDSETYSQLNKLCIFEAVTRTTSKIKISRPTLSNHLKSVSQPQLPNIK